MCCRVSNDCFYFCVVVYIHINAVAGKYVITFNLFFNMQILLKSLLLRLLFASCFNNFQVYICISQALVSLITLVK